MIHKAIRIFSTLTFFSGIAAFINLAALPSDAQNGLFNLSLFRLISLSAILTVICVSAFIFFRFKSEARAAGLAEWIAGFKPGIFLSFILFAISLAAWVALLYKETWTSLFSEAVYLRLAPLMLLGSLLCIQAAVVLLLPRLNFKEFKHSIKPAWGTSLVIAAAFALIALLISITGIGFNADHVGLNWGPAGTPVTFAQVNLVLAIGFLLSFLIYLIGSRITSGHSRWLLILDSGIFLALWGLAVILWSNQTMSPTHFAPLPSAPNYEYYPYSDAAVFDRLSYRLMSGLGFSDILVRRPLYVGMLALFHKLGGVGYDETISLQILTLALIPAFIYLLTSRLSTRLAGFIAGGLVVLRETNAIELSGKIVTSHAQLFMSDLTATLGIVIFVYACIILFSKPNHDKWLLLIVGAILGLTALVRAQSLILVPLILLFALLPQKMKKPLFISSGVILLGLMLAILPWAWRNWNITGSPALGDAGEKILMARNYSLNPIEYPQPLTGESTPEFSDRLSQQIVSFILEHPGNVAFFVSNHFMRSLAVSAVYIAPLYSADSPASLVDQTPFWGDWNGNLPGNSLLPLLANLSMLAFGISLAQKENKLAGWYPLMVFVVYQAGNALARTSGWRFALPADWIILVYYSIALAYLPSKLGLLFKKFPINQAAPAPVKTNPAYPAALLILCLMAVSIPVVERLIPEQKFDSVADKAKNALIEENILTSGQLAEFLEQKNAVFISGLALYPRYYKPDGSIYLTEMPENFKYLHFWLINNDNMQIVLPREKPPGFFPHASAVSIIGCKESGYISALAVFVQTETEEQFVLQEPFPLLVCP